MKRYFAFRNYIKFARLFTSPHPKKLYFNRGFLAHMFILFFLTGAFLSSSLIDLRKAFEDSKIDLSKMTKEDLYSFKEQLRLFLLTNRGNLMKEMIKNFEDKNDFRNQISKVFKALSPSLIINLDAALDTPSLIDASNILSELIEKNLQEIYLFYIFNKNSINSKDDIPTDEILEQVGIIYDENNGDSLKKNAIITIYNLLKNAIAAKYSKAGLFKLPEDVLKKIYRMKEYLDDIFYKIRSEKLRSL